MSYRLNTKKLDAAMKAYKGGAEAVFKAANTSSSKYYYNINKGSFDSAFLISLCEVININPANFFEELDQNNLPIAAEPEGEYNTPGANINRIILERLTIIQDKFDTCTAEMIKKIDHLEMLVSEKH